MPIEARTARVGSVLVDVKVQVATLEDINFAESVVQRVHLKRLIARDCKGENVEVRRVSVGELVVVNSSIRDSMLSEACIGSLSAVGLDAKGAKFSELNVSGVVENSSFDRARFEGAKFSDFHMLKSKAFQAEFRGCAFTGVRFSESNLSLTRFIECVFEECVVENCRMTGALFDYCVGNLRSEDKA